MSSKSSYRWIEVQKKAPFNGVDGHGLVVFQNRLWMLGGWDPRYKEIYPRTCSNEIWSTADGVDWKLEMPNTYGFASFDPERHWEGRHCCGWFDFEGELWVVGGDFCQRQYYICDIWKSPDGHHWSRVCANPPWAPRTLHYTAAYHGYLWVMGGQELANFAGKNNPAILYNDVWRSRDGVNWEKMETQAPMWKPRGLIGGSAILNDRLWLLGGGTFVTNDMIHRDFYNDVWSTADGIHWTCHCEHAPWIAREFHDIIAFDNKLWVIAGCVAEGNRYRNLQDAWYSSDGVEWHKLEVPWEARHATGLAVFNDALWVIAGNNMKPDVWKLRKSEK